MLHLRPKLAPRLFVVAAVVAMAVANGALVAGLLRYVGSDVAIITGIAGGIIGACAGLGYVIKRLSELERRISST